MDAGLEAELIARARAGDRAMLSELYRTYEPELVRMVELRLAASLRRRVDPADVVQQAWIEILRRFDEWCARDDVPFRVWVRLTTRQAVAEATRRYLAPGVEAASRDERAYLSSSNVSAVGMADAFVASTTSPTQGALREELRIRVLDAIESLDPIDREIVALRHLEGLSNADTAAELEIEPAAASKRYTRALLRLRPQLASLVSGSRQTGE
jgi:RNA polymerase sigma-70 factor (ECF subfamily)